MLLTTRNINGAPDTGFIVIFPTLTRAGKSPTGCYCSIPLDLPLYSHPAAIIPKLGELIVDKIDRPAGNWLGLNENGRSYPQPGRDF
jgi:hypothetical protein